MSRNRHDRSDTTGRQFRRSLQDQQQHRNTRPVSPGLNESHFDRNAFDMSFGNGGSVAASNHSSDLSSEDEFESDMQRCSSTVDILRGFGTRPATARRYRTPRTATRGPIPTKLKIKIYHLPEAASVPRLHPGKKGYDPELLRQMDMGYGFSKSCWNPITSKSKYTSISLQLNERQFKDFIREQCPKLAGGPFLLYKVTQQHRFMTLSTTPAEIKASNYKGIVIVYSSSGEHHHQWVRSPASSSPGETSSSTITRSIIPHSASTTSRSSATIPISRSRSSTPQNSRPTPRTMVSVVPASQPSPPATTPTSLPVSSITPRTSVEFTTPVHSSRSSTPQNSQPTPRTMVSVVPASQPSPPATTPMSSPVSSIAPPTSMEFTTPADSSDTNAPPSPSQTVDPVQDPAQEDLLWSLEVPQTSTATYEVLIVNRYRAFADMIKHFDSDEILNKDVKFRIQNERGVLEMGEDMGGVFREILSIFWKEFYNSRCLGESEKVPTIRHDVHSEEWASAGRILIKGHRDVGYFPVMLNKVFLYGVFFEDEIDHKTLLASYLNYLSNGDSKMLRDVLNRGVDDELDDGETEELLDILSDLKAKRMATTAPELKELLLELAHMSLVQQPAFVRNIWKNIAVKADMQNSKISFAKMIKDSTPTPRGVANLIKVSGDAVPEGKEKEAFDWLLKYVKDLTENDVKDFLRFATGADMMCVERISVTFTKIFGLNQRIVAHTCACVLEMPITYDSYMDFKGRFTEQLKCCYWDMDFI